MRIAHYTTIKPPSHPTLITDEFGNELIAVPSQAVAMCWTEFYETQMVNEDSWLSLFRFGDVEAE